MDQRSLIALDWHRLLTLLSLCATSEEGRESALSVKPLTAFSEVDGLHRKVDEWAKAERLQGKLYFEGCKRVSVRTPKGSFLPLETFRVLLRDLELWVKLKLWLKDPQTEKRALLPAFSDDENLEGIYLKLKKLLDERGEVADSASPELHRLRREREKALEKVSSFLKKTMDRIGSSAFSQGNPTIINGRIVLPIIAAKKGLLPGIQLDTSSSGVTLYIEPFEAVELNNTLSDFEAKEREEIKKILTVLSEDVAQMECSFNKLFDTVVYFDLILARARLGSRYKGIFPTMPEKNDAISLRNAFHPLLIASLNTLREEAWGEKPKSGAVPLEIDLAMNETKTLILSGPNGGGKTVALKTMGLLSLMNQSGIPIPAEEGAALPIFETLLALIGDPQSIAEDSSTFTARMRHLAEGIKTLKPPFLVLLDELGAGTDPIEGYAIGKEILFYFHSRQGFLLTTTHDETIKALALTTKGMKNGAFGFSETTGKPTYQLKIGIIGRSRALEMAGSAGIPEEILKRAKEEIPDESRKIGKLLDNLEQELVSIEKAKNSVEIERESLANKKKEMEKEREGLEEEKRKILRNLPQKLAEWREDFLSRRRCRNRGKPVWRYIG